MGKRKSEQAPLWIPTTELPVSPGFPESSLRENLQRGSPSGISRRISVLLSKSDEVLAREAAICLGESAIESSQFIHQLVPDASWMVRFPRLALRHPSCFAIRASCYGPIAQARERASPYGLVCVRGVASGCRFVLATGGLSLPRFPPRRLRQNPKAAELPARG